MLNVDAKIKELREKANLRQDQVAAYLGVDQDKFSAMENVECVMTAEQQERLDELCSGNAEAFVEFTAEDMRAIAAVNHIAANSRYMAKLLEHV